MSRSPHLEFIRDTWHGVFYLPHMNTNGKSGYRRRRISLHVRGKENKRKAQKELSKLERELLVDDRPIETGTVRKLADEYLRSAKLNVRSGTFDIYRHAVSLFIGLWGDLDCCDINPVHIERFKEHLRGRYSVATTNMHLRAVKTMFTFGARLKLISNNPCSTLKQLRPEPKGFPPYITMQDFEQAVAHLHGKMTALPHFADSYSRQLAVLSLAMYAGLRRAEAQNLQWKHVSLEKKEIRIALTDSFVTKSGKERVVPIIPRLNRVLLLVPKTGTYVVSGTDQIPTRTYATTVWARVRRELDPPILIPYHGLRHSFATWLSSQPGVSLKTVSEVLGHADIQTTMIYSHVQRSDLDQLKILE